MKAGEKENALITLLKTIVIVVVAVMRGTPLAAQDGPSLVQDEVRHVPRCRWQRRDAYGQEAEHPRFEFTGGTEAD